MLKLRANTAKKNLKRNLIFYNYIFISIYVQNKNTDKFSDSKSAIHDTQLENDIS